MAGNKGQGISGFNKKGFPLYMASFKTYFFRRFFEGKKFIDRNPVWTIIAVLLSQ